MPFQSAPNMLEVITDFNMQGAATANVLHFRFNDRPTQAAVSGFARLIDGVAGAYALAHFTPTQSYVGTRTKGLTEENDYQGANSDSAVVGTQPEIALPNNVSLCITLRSEVTGRSARGRFYMQPPNAGDMVGPNQVSSAYAAQVVAYVTALKAILNLEGGTLVVLSRYANKVLRSVAIGFPVALIVARNTRTDSQRGRMPLPG